MCENPRIGLSSDVKPPWPSKGFLLSATAFAIPGEVSYNLFSGSQMTYQTEVLHLGIRGLNSC